MENLFENCNLCPRRCGADRTSGKTGFCRMPGYPLVNLIKLHYGEDPEPRAAAPFSSKDAA